MAGRINGAAALIQHMYPLAIYCHCCSHKLNLCVAFGAKNMPLVINMMDHVREISDFFNKSVPRTQYLTHVLQTTLPDASKTKLINVCRTRWVERLDGFDIFMEYFTAIVTALEDMKIRLLPSFNDDTVTKATQFFYLATSFEFIVVLVIVKSVLGHTRPLTKILQGREIDLLRASTEASELKCILDEQRSQIDSHYEIWYSKILALAASVGTHESKPRTTSVQRYRMNHDVKSVKDYWRVAVAVPFLEYVKEEIGRRFSIENDIIYNGMCIVPAMMQVVSGWKAKFQGVLDQYKTDFPEIANVDAEIFRWERKWAHYEGDRPSTITTTLHETDEFVFPTIREALRILLTLPITSCECERKISTLRLIKTWNRSTMGQSKLNSLCLLMTHRDIEINPMDVVDAFAREKPRRMALKNIFDEEESE